MEVTFTHLIFLFTIGYTAAAIDKPVTAAEITMINTPVEKSVVGFDKNYTHVGMDIIIILSHAREVRPPTFQPHWQPTSKTNPGGVSAIN